MQLPYKYQINFIHLFTESWFVSFFKKIKVFFIQVYNAYGCHPYVFNLESEFAENYLIYGSYRKRS